MGIFNRLKGIAKADIHHAIDKIEDPVKMVKQYLRDLEGEIGKAEKALSNQLFIEKKYEVMIAQTEQTIEKRMRQAQLAVDRNEDEIAKLALQDKINSEKKLAQTKVAYEAIKQQTQSLYSQVKKLQETYEALQQKKLVLIARANAAQASQHVNQTLTSFSPQNALQGFSRMEEQILNLEAKATASQNLYEMKRPEATVFFDQLLQDEVQKELDLLKQAKPTTR